MENNMARFQIGDFVKVSITDDDILKQMQKNLDNWKTKMRKCLQGPCEVKQVHDDFVLVSTGSGNSFRIHPNVLVHMFVSEVQSGQEMWVLLDKDVVARSQGGWHESMTPLLGQKVTVVDLCGKGRVCVRFGSTTWMLSEACLSFTKPQPSSAVLRNARRHSETCVYKRYPFLVGDFVKVSETDENILRRKHEYLGGWSVPMRECLWDRCQVKEVQQDHLVLKGYSGRVYRVNPEVVESSSSCMVPGREMWVSSDEEKVAHGQGGWHESMRPLLGHKVTVLDACGERRFRVRAGSTTWVLSEACLCDTEPSFLNSSTDSSHCRPQSDYICNICLDRSIEIIFPCGHSACFECSEQLDDCHMCRQKITNKIKIFL